MMECVLALALAMSMGVSLGMLYHATQAMKLMHDAVGEHRQMVRRIIHLENERNDLLDAIAKEIRGQCVCSEGWTSRGLIDSDCQAHDHADIVESYKWPTTPELEQEPKP